MGFASAILVPSTFMIQRLWKLCMRNEKQFNSTRNPARENFFGYSRAECEGKHVIELMVGPTDATITTEIMHLILEGESHGGEFVLKNKKGELFTVIRSTKPLRDENGKIIGMIGIATFPKPNQETSLEPKVGVPIHTASDQTLQSDLAIEVKSKVKNHDYKHNQPGIYNILSPTADWMVNHVISWPSKGNEKNERRAAGCDARACFHWLYHTDLELTCIQQMGSCMPAKIERQPQVNTTTLIRSFNKLYEIKWEDLMIRECIRKGSYETLYHAVWYGSDVVVKRFPRQGYSHDLRFFFMQEVSFMKRFWHPNILLFMGAIVSPQHLCIVSEFLARGSLFQLLHRSRCKFKLKHHGHMALDIARGMNYLHSYYPPIIHCDLKSSNLYVDKHWTVKPAWMASEKSDVYCFGMVLWEIITEKVPWNGLSSTQVAKAVGFMNQRLDIPKDVDS